MKWEKQNQQKTLKNLIENPKEFLKPKLAQVREESEIILNPIDKI